MNTSARKWGNSLAIRLPRHVADAAAIYEGSTVTVEAREGRVVLTPVREPVFRLSRMVKAIRETNRHASVDTGKPRGREVW